MSIVKKPFSRTRTLPKYISGFILSKKKTFSGPILPKKKIKNMAIFGQKPWVNPF